MMSAMCGWLASNAGEIARSAALRGFGACLAATHVFTFVFWTVDRDVPAMLSSEGDPICWPFFADCHAWRVGSTSAWWALLCVYVAASLAAMVLFLKPARARLAIGLLAGATVLKLLVFVQDYRLMGNYHYMAFLATLVFLVVPRKVDALRYLLVAFYVSAGALKLNAEWLSGAALLRPSVLSGAALEAACAYVVVLELGLVWGLLSRRRSIAIATLAQLALFHAFSWHIVGWFYPCVMACLLAIFPLAWREERRDVGVLRSPLVDLLRWRTHGAHYAMLAVYAALQAAPLLYPGDPAVTGEGRMFALNMLDAKTVCRPTFVLRFEGRAIEQVAPRSRLGVRIACDPITHLSQARARCRRHAGTPGFRDLDYHLWSRRTTDGDDTLVADVRDFCRTNPRFDLFAHNAWILPREAAAAPLPSPPTFEYRGPRRDGVSRVERAPSRLRRAWEHRPLNVGIHGASKASPAVDESGVYVGADTGWFHAFDRAGKVRWKFFAARAGRGIHGTAALDDARVYFGAYNGVFYALSKRDGRALWSRKLGAAIGASPALVGDHVYIAVETSRPPDGFVAKLDRRTGRISWRSPRLGEQAHSSPTVAPELGLAFVGANNGALTALDLATGRVAWRRDVGAPIKGTAAQVGHRLVFASWNGHAEAVDARTGTPLWKVALGAKSQSSPTCARAAGVCLVGAHNGILFGVDLADGRERWRVHTSQERYVASALVLRTHDGVERAVAPCGAAGPAISAADAPHHRDGRADAQQPPNGSALCLFEPRTGVVLDRQALAGALTGVPVHHEASVYVALDDPGGLARFDFEGAPRPPSQAPIVHAGR